MKKKLSHQIVIGIMKLSLTPLIILITASMNGGHWGDSARRWDVVWKNISNCNAFFDNIEKVPFTDADLKNA